MKQDMLNSQIMHVFLLQFPYKLDNSLPSIMATVSLTRIESKNSCSPSAILDAQESVRRAVVVLERFVSDRSKPATSALAVDLADTPHETLACVKLRKAVVLLERCDRANPRIGTRSPSVTLERLSAGEIEHIKTQLAGRRKATTGVVFTACGAG